MVKQHIFWSLTNAFGAKQKKRKERKAKKKEKRINKCKFSCYGLGPTVVV